MDALVSGKCAPFCAVFFPRMSELKVCYKRMVQEKSLGPLKTQLAMKTML